MRESPQPMSQKESEFKKVITFHPTQKKASNPVKQYKTYSWVPKSMEKLQIQTSKVKVSFLLIFIKIRIVYTWQTSKANHASHQSGIHRSVLPYDPQNDQVVINGTLGSPFTETSAIYQQKYLIALHNSRDFHLNIGGKKKKTTKEQPVSLL